MMKMWTSVSNTAEFGGLSTRDRVITEDTRKAMKQMLKEIQSGKFADTWLKDAQSGMKKLDAMEKDEADSRIEVVGKEIRALFEKK
jgi:ketol-acid reductoisomerase